jgi:hypothetical protein
LAVVLHVAFLEALMFKVADKTPERATVTANAPLMSAYLVRVATPSNTLLAKDDRTPAPARAKAAASAKPEIETPNPAPETLKITPRPAPIADPVLPTPQAAATILDLQSEPAPLHGEARPAPEAGSPPTPSAAPDCALAQAIQLRITQDQTLRVSIEQIPHQSRSVANAIMVWDGAWTTAVEGRGREPLSVLQAAVREMVQASSAYCHQQPVRGPQFITVVEPAGTTVLVVGSGVWRWGDLLR